MKDLYVALVHHPVYDRTGRVVTTAVTNFDVHDIARSARTYGVRAYFVVTPVEAQRQMVTAIVAHWDMEGAKRNPERAEALKLVRTIGTIDDARAHAAAECGKDPLVVATSARPIDGDLAKKIVDFPAARGLVQERPVLLLFGTGWGLTDEVLAAADRLLPPLRGADDYNHLSVRSAAATILDRLCARSG